MSNRIEILPESVQHMIAAGEVVEGPFSVIKELIENSIDANSDSIYVEAEDSGFKKILVRDNGDGIYKDDIKLSVLEHATSKIRNIQDISLIGSYGFRGEALSSISSISKLTIFSRTEDETVGGKIIIDGKNIIDTDYAGPKGTTVIVENLFYNTPARKKFLKSKAAESRVIREVFIKVAQACPGITFTLALNNKKPLILKKCDSLEERIAQIHGREVSENLYYEKLQDIQVEIEGFLSKPSFLKASRNMQFLYVNGRPVDLKNFGFFLSKSYEAIAARGQYPAAFVFITIKPDLIDVNIHPAKREIKFFDQKYITSLIFSLAKKVLGKQEHKIENNNLLRFKPDIGEEQLQNNENSGNAESQKSDIGNSESFHSTEKLTGESGSGTTYENTSLLRDNTSMDDNPQSRESNLWNETQERGALTDGQSVEKNNNEFLNFTSSDIIKESKSIYSDYTEQNSGENYYSILGNLFGTYILVEHEELLKIIDFHAAHERFIYDEILSSAVKPEVQELMFPLMMELSVLDYEIVVENSEFFTDRGFEIDQMSDNTIAVRAVPDLVKNIKTESLILDMIDGLKNEGDHFEVINKRIASSIACHSAKRANDKMSYEDMKIIVDKCFSGKFDLRCPHGRPFVYKIGQGDFEKLFKRAL